MLSMMSMGYYVSSCPKWPEWPIDSFLYLNLSAVFYFVDYTRFLGILGKVVNILSTFAWNFNDIFVMAVSVALASRFRLLNDYMLREARMVSFKELSLGLMNYFNNSFLAHNSQLLDAVPRQLPESLQTM